MNVRIQLFILGIFLLVNCQSKKSAFDTLKENESKFFVENSEQLKDLQDVLNSPLNGVWDKHLNVPTFISGPLPLTSFGFERMSGAKTVASAILKKTISAFGIQSRENELMLVDSTIDQNGTQHLRYAQVYKGLSVFGRSFNMHVATQEKLSAISSNFYPRLHVESIHPAWTAERAIQRAMKLVKNVQKISNEEPKLLIYAGFKSQSLKPELSWYMEFRKVNSGLINGYFVSAKSGSLLDSVPRTFTAIDRTIYKYKSQACVISSAPTRTEGQRPTGDIEVDRAYDMLKFTFDYYKTHGCDSYDCQGAALVTIANYQIDCPYDVNNSWWDQTNRRFFFGKGRSTKDMTAHEFTHAHIENAGCHGMSMAGETGALCESICDIFGVLVDTNNWEIGEGLSNPRSLEDPEKYNFPDHTNKWDPECEIHTNSTIFSKAFYNIASVIGRDDAGKIIYQTLNYMTYSSKFKDARAYIIQATTELFGEDSVQLKSVIAGFDKVGITATWESPDCANVNL